MWRGLVVLCGKKTGWFAVTNTKHNKTTPSIVDLELHELYTPITNNDVAPEPKVTPVHAAGEMMTTSTAAVDETEIFKQDYLKKQRVGKFT